MLDLFLFFLTAASLGTRTADSLVQMGFVLLLHFCSSAIAVVYCILAILGTSGCHAEWTVFCITWCWDSLCEGSLTGVLCGGRGWNQPVFGSTQLDILENRLFETKLEVCKGGRTSHFSSCCKIPPFSL